MVAWDGLLAAAGGGGDGAVLVDDGDRGDFPGALGETHAVLALDGVGCRRGMVELGARLGAVGADVAGDEGRGVGRHALGLDLDGPINRRLGLIRDLLLVGASAGLDLGGLGFGCEGAGRPCAAEPQPRDDERDRGADGDLPLQRHCAVSASIGYEVEFLVQLVLGFAFVLIHVVAFL